MKKLLESSIVLLLIFCSLASAAEPWPSHLPKCSTECPVTGSSVLNYLPEKTYSYLYSGFSQVHLRDISDGIAKTEGSLQVDFSWLSPCDVAISLKDVSGEIAEGFPDLFKYPMLMAVSDGRVQHVCVHPDDDPPSINVKKGVASAFQNSLPTTSEISSGLNFTEVDVVGKCSTRYEVEKKENTLHVKKMKNHRLCHNRFYTKFETHYAWSRAPLPLEESRSECNQEITNGIYTKIICEDNNTIRLSYGAYRYVVATQKSSFSYLSESSNIPESVSSLQGHLVRQNLLFDHRNNKKELNLHMRLIPTLRHICEKTKNTIEEDTAPLLAEVIATLRKVPDEIIETLLQNIASGEVCPEHHRLESLYLDAIAFVYEPGAVSIMVKELVSGRATADRAALYTAAFHMTPRPNLKSIEALQPLFEASRTFGFAKIAAASLVHRYCRHNPHCINEAPVRQLAETIAGQIDQQCIPSEGRNLQKEALAALKSLGNMGVINSEISKSVIKCIETDGVHNTIRIAAAQAFRNAKCDRHTTKQLINIMVDRSKNTEVRIASYLAAIRCAEKEDLTYIISKITSEDNTQVRGFVLSHLLNIQESTAPHKESLRHLLTDDVLPLNFTQDFRKYSRNIDKSFYIQSLGLGAGMESDIIFSPGSYIPRSVDLNITGALGGFPSNFVELGARLEGLESVIEKFFGPNGHLHKFSIGSILQNFFKSLKDEGGKLLENIIPNIRQRRSIDLASISNFLKYIYERGESDVQRADLYVRLGGQELIYGHFSGDLKNANINKFSEDIYAFIDEMLTQLIEGKTDTARAAQLRFDYSIPTIQGIPLKMKLEGTTVFGMKLDNTGNVKGGRSGARLLDIMPGLSIHVNGFLGYKSFLGNSGIVVKNLISSSNGLSVSFGWINRKDFHAEINLPDKMELFNVKSETYLTQNGKFFPRSVRDIRYQSKHCLSRLQSVLGLKFCHDIDVPNIFHSVGLPLGKPSIIKFFVEKTDPSLRKYVLKASHQNNEEGHVISVKADAPGSSIPRNMESTISYKRDQDSYFLSASVESSSINSNVFLNLIHHDDYKAVETFVKWNSAGVESKGGFKVEMKTRRSENGKEMDINVYSSRNKEFSNDSRIVEASLSLWDKDHDLLVRLKTSTVQQLKEIISLDFQMFVYLEHYPSLGIWIPQRIDSLDFNCQAGNFLISATIRERFRGVYHIYSTVGRMNVELFSIYITYIMHGSSILDMEVTTTARGHFMEAGYELENIIAFRTGKRGVFLAINRQGEEKHIVYFEALASTSSEMHQAKFAIDLPELMKAIKCEAKLTRQEEDNFMLEAAFQHDQKFIIQMHGPVRASGSLSTSNIEADIKITTLLNSPVKLKFILDWGSKKQLFVVDLRNEREVLFSGDWLLKVERTQEWTIKTKFNFPLITDSNIEVLIRDKAVQISTNNLMFPKSSYARRVKGHIGVNFEELEVKVALAWDADRDRYKKMSVDLKMIPSATNPDHFIFHGNAIYLGKPYGLTLDYSGFDENPWRREFNLRIATDTRQTLHVDVSLRFLQEPTLSKLEGVIAFKDLQDTEHKFDSFLIVFHDQGRPGRLKFKTQTSYLLQNKNHLAVEFEFDYSDTASERFLDIKTGILIPNLHSPMTLWWRIDNKINVYSMELTFLVGLPVNFFKWEVVHHPNMGVKSILLDIDLAAAIDILEFFHFGLKPHINSHPSVEDMKRTVYHFNYNRPSPHKHIVAIKYPSRAIEAEVEHSPSQYSVKFSPNTERNDEKYEIVATVINVEDSTHHQVSEWQGRISHPSLPRDLESSLQFRREGDSIRGRIELDLFHNKEDRIVGSMESTRVSPNTIWIEISLSAKSYDMKPRVSVTAAYAPHVVSFDLKFRKSPSSEVSVLMAGKIDRSHGKEAALAFTLHKEGHPLLELSGSVAPDERQSCNGLGIKSILQSPAFGLYRVNSKLCKPLFLEVSANAKGNDNVFIAKLGYKEPNDAEFSITVEDKDTFQRLVLLMAKLSLGSPTQINIDLARATEPLRTIQIHAREQWNKMTAVLPAWKPNSGENPVQRETSLSKPSHPPSHLLTLLARLRDEIIGICQDGIPQIRQNPIVVWLKPYVVNSWLRVDKIQKDLRHIRNEVIQAFNKNFREVADSLVEVIVKILRLLEEGKGTEFLNWIRGSLETIPEVQKLERIMKELIQQHPDEMEALQVVYGKIMRTLERDFDNLREMVSQIPDIQRKVYWTLGNYDLLLGLQMDKLISRILHDLLFISVKTEEHHLRIEIPTYRPLNSVTQALKYLTPKPASMIKDLVWLYYSFEPASLHNFIWGIHSLLPERPKDFFPPYNRTAVIVEGTEIITFDGVVLRLPPSPCRVLLLNHKSISFLMEHLQPNLPPQLIITSHEMEVTIQPNNEINIKGELMGTALVREGDIEVIKNSKEIKVVSPYVTIRILKRTRTIMVDVTGWTFGHTVGLLGTYDNEIANDWLTLRGTRANTLQELVRSWQENQQCETPDVFPVDPERVPEFKAIKCNALLNGHSICRSVIQPEPFIQMCYATNDVCHAEKAYQAICENKGIRQTFFLPC
nr:vitellogenin [Neocaridina davidi]